MDRGVDLMADFHSIILSPCIIYCIRKAFEKLSLAVSFWVSLSKYAREYVIIEILKLEDLTNWATFTKFFYPSYINCCALVILMKGKLNKQ
jgi:hypothetical protein